MHSRIKSWMRLVPMALPFSTTNAFSTQTTLTKSLVLSNSSYGHILIMPSLKDSKSMSLFSHKQANFGDDRLETQPTLPLHIDKVLNDNTLDDETPTMVGGYK